MGAYPGAVITSCLVRRCSSSSSSDSRSGSSSAGGSREFVVLPLVLLPPGSKQPNQERVQKDQSLMLRVLGCHWAGQNCTRGSRQRRMYVHRPPPVARCARCRGAHALQPPGRGPCSRARDLSRNFCKPGVCAARSAGQQAPRASRRSLARAAGGARELKSKQAPLSRDIAGTTAPTHRQLLLARCPACSSRSGQRDHRQTTSW